jgi:septal ring factor EnvC (AmiA/AmiB activator)
MIKRLEKQVIECSQQTECLTSNIHTIELQLSSAKAELQKEVDSNAKLAREIKESNFEKQELQQQINKITF